jgi:hypothetical protein
VGRLDSNLSDADLTYFLPLRSGPREAVIMREKGTDASRGFAFLHFEQWRSMEDCMAPGEMIAPPHGHRQAIAIARPRLDPLSSTTNHKQNKPRTLIRPTLVPPALPASRAPLSLPNVLRENG